MDITCPKCHFTRSIADDKIPAHAVRATCPKCAHKFQFRALDDDFLLEEDPPFPSAPPAPPPPVFQAPGQAAAPVQPTVQPTGQPLAREVAKESAPLLRAATPRKEPEGPARRPLIPWDDEPEEPGEEELDDASSLLRPPPRAAGKPQRERDEDPLARLMRSTTPPGMTPDADDTDDDEDDFSSTLLSRRPAPSAAAPRRASPLLRTDLEHDDPVRAEHVKPVFQPLLQEPDSKTPEGDAEDIWRKLERLDDAETPRQSPAEDWKPAGEDAQASVEAPWERLDRHGFFGGLWRTTSRAMFHPGLFFEALPVDKGLGRPLAYYVILSLLGHALMLPWALTTAELMLSWISSPVVAGWLQSLLSPQNQAMHTLLMPVLSTVQIFFTTSILHVSLFVFQGGGRGYEATFRAMAYSAAPLILYLIPFLGPVIANIWSLAVLIVGLRRIQRTSYLQVLLAMLLPVAALVVLVFSVVYALSGGAA